MDYIRHRKDGIKSAIAYTEKNLEDLKETKWENEKERLTKSLTILQTAYDEVMEQIPINITVTFNDSYTVSSELKYKDKLIYHFNPPKRPGKNFDGFYLFDKRYGGIEKVEEATDDMHVYGFWEDDLSFRDFRKSVADVIENKRVFNYTEGLVVIEQITCNKDILVKNCQFNKLDNLFNWIMGTKKITLENCTVKEMSLVGLFAQCTELEEVHLELGSNKVKSLAGTFAICISMQKIDLSGFDFSQLEAMNEAFYNCYKLTEIVFPSSKTTEVQTIKELFVNCRNLQEIDLSFLDTSKVTDASDVFAGCTNLHRLKNVPSSFTVDDSNNIVSIRCANEVFKQNLQFLGGEGNDWLVRYWSESEVNFLLDKEIIFSGYANPDGLFINAKSETGSYIAVTCGQLIVIDTEGVHKYGEFNFNELEVAPHLSFVESEITILSLEDFNKSLTTGQESFEHVLFTESISGFEPVAKQLTFKDCYFPLCANAFENQKLNSITFNNCKFGFKNPYQLANLKWADASNMFNGCEANKIELNSIDISAITNFEGFFNNCTNLTTIVCNQDFHADQTIPNAIVFNNCPKLVGGKGTEWNESNVRLNYAHPDSEHYPGYFSM